MRMNRYLAAGMVAMTMLGGGVGPAMAADTTATGSNEGTVQSATDHVDTAGGTAQSSVTKDGSYRVRQGNTLTETRKDGSVAVYTVADTDNGDTVYTGCQVYYPAGAKINLATIAENDDCWGLQSSGLAKVVDGQSRNFLGWSEKQVADVTDTASQQAAGVTTTITMPASAKTVWAVWAARPVLNYDIDLPKEYTGQAPATPESISVDYGAQVADGSVAKGWTVGAKDKVKGWKFTGWHTAQDDTTPLYWANGNPALTSNVTVYASYERLGVKIHYDKNAQDAKGSHGDTSCWQYADCTVATDLNKDGSKDRFTRAGWKLTGWNTKPGGDGTKYGPGDVIHMTDVDVTLYAQWVRTVQMLPMTGNEGEPASPGVLLPGVLGVGLLSGIAYMVRRRFVHDAPKHK